MNSCVGTASTAVRSWVALMLPPSPFRAPLRWTRPASSRWVHDQAGELEREGGAQVPSESLDGFAAPGRHPEGVRQLDEIWVGEVGPEVAAELLVLLPHDRAELGVLPDDVDDRGLQPHRRLELLHVHQEAAVAVDGHHAPAG